MVFHRGAQVEILEITCDIACPLSRHDTVYHDFYHGEVSSFGADISGVVVNLVTAACPSYSARVFFFRAKCRHNEAKIGGKTQFSAAPDNTPKLDADIKHLQEVLGTLLYYAQAVDLTMLVAIGTLATEQSIGTEKTLTNLVHLLNYCATHPNATVRYSASNMILHIKKRCILLIRNKIPLTSNWLLLPQQQVQGPY